MSLLCQSSSRIFVPISLKSFKTSKILTFLINVQIQWTGYNFIDKFKPLSFKKLGPKMSTKDKKPY